jgi:hypothetical protein
MLTCFNIFSVTLYVLAQDVATLTNGLKLSRTILKQSAFDGIVTKEVFPGSNKVHTSALKHIYYSTNLL